MSLFSDYKFNESSGNALDSGPRQIHAAAVGSPGAVSGGGRSFVGNVSSFKVENWKAGTLGSHTLKFELWFEYGATQPDSWQELFCVRYPSVPGGSPAIHAVIEDYGNALRFNLYDEDASQGNYKEVSLLGTDLIQAGKKYHLVCERDIDVLRITLNGHKIAEAACPATRHFNWADTPTLHLASDGTTAGGFSGNFYRLKIGVG